MINIIIVVFITLAIFRVDAAEDIIVKGIIAGDEPIVIINDQAYKIGDKFSMYTVQDIAQTGVVLENDGDLVFHYISEAKKHDWPDFEMKYKFKMTHRPKEFYTAINCWTKAYHAESLDEVIELHKLAISSAEKAMIKVDSLARAQLGKTCFDSREYIKDLENFRKEES